MGIFFSIELITFQNKKAKPPGIHDSLADFIFMATRLSLSRSVAFRPRLTTGLAFSKILNH
jgi:hypothetical protein